MKWFRLYSEARNDSKLKHLEDDEHRVWFNLLCLSNDQPTRGSIAYHSYFLLSVEVASANEELLKRTLEKLKLFRIVEDTDNTVTFINFKKRQYDNLSDRPENVRRRVQRYRKNKEKESVTTGNDHVTACNDHVTACNGLYSDTDTDTESETETDPEEKEKENYIKEKESARQVVLLPDEVEYIATLETVEDYPVDRKTDLEYYHTLQVRYPQLNVLDTVRDWAIYKKDKPLQENSSPRAQINTFCKNDVRWGRNLKQIQPRAPASSNLVELDPSLVKKYGDARRRGLICGRSSPKH